MKRVRNLEEPQSNTRKLICHSLKRSRPADLVHLTPEDYTVGWICALPIELAAGQAMLDKKHQNLQLDDDENTYTLGSIKGHNVVLVCLNAGRTGTNSAATVVTQLARSFKSLRFGLLVGIGGGIPTETDVRLGDVVVCQPDGEHGGVIQYDLGKMRPNGHWERTGALNSPPSVLLSALGALQAEHLGGNIQFPLHLESIIGRQGYGHPGAEHDILFMSDFHHKDGPTCNNCIENTSKILYREPREPRDSVMIHYGTIASGNRMMKDGVERDYLAVQHKGILCFEMEAAGVMNSSLQFLVIRGISDYADSHKNDKWQRYAAATASAFGKELLGILQPRNVGRGGSVSQSIHGSCIDYQGREYVQALDKLTIEEQVSLQSLSFEEMHHRMNDIEEPAEDTCAWILENNTYQKWVGLTHGLLRVKGKPGAGKSTLLKHLLDINLAGRVDDAIVSFFFFHGRGSSLQRSHLGFFRSILHQIFLQVPTLRIQFSRLYQRRCESEGPFGVKWNWQEKELQQIFRNQVTNSTVDLPIRVYIDALDECGQDEAIRLIDFLERTIRSAPAGKHCSICFSCRSYSLTASEFGLDIYVHNENRSDIDLYILQRLSKVFQVSQESEFLRKNILNKSKGSFQWAKLIVSRICDDQVKGKNFRAIVMTLADLPSEISQIYRELIKKIPPNEWSRALQMLEWVCFALRPLSLEELRYAMLVPTDTMLRSIHECQESPEYIESDDQMRKQVVYLSGGLAEVKQHEGVEFVQFIHQSVNDYLLDEGLQLLNPHGYCRVVGPANFRLSRSCIDFFTMDDVETHSNTNEKVKNERPVPFLLYAIQNWALHAQVAEKEGISQNDLLSHFSPTQMDFFENWVRLLEGYQVWDIGPVRFRKGKLLHLLVSLGMERTAKLLLDRGDVDINALQDRDETPLLCATKYKHQNTVELLLSCKTIDANVADNYGDTPLMYALRWRNIDVVKLLLSHSEVAHLFEKNISGYSPFSEAAISGADFTKLLLSDVKSDEIDSSGQTVLSHVARSGKLDAIQLVLMRDNVKTDLRDKEGRTPLSWAAEYGDEPAVKLLADREDVNADSRDNEGRTPLSWAAFSREGETVNALADRDDVNADSRDNEGQTPLSWAAWCGNSKAVELLVEREDVKADSKDDDGRTPLSWAAEFGDIKTIELLTGRDDVNADSRDNDGQTPLSWAAEYGDIKKIQMLAHRSDVDADSRDNDGRTPLSWSAECGNAKAVEFFAGRDDVEVDSRDFNGRTPLCWAAEFGDAHTMDLLARRAEVDLNSRDNDGRTPLSHAAASGNIATVKMLIEKYHVHPWMADHQGQAPLWWAECEYKTALEENRVEEFGDYGQTLLFLRSL